MVRPSTTSDIGLILRLVQGAAELEGLVFSPEKAERVIQVCTSSSKHFCAVTEGVTGCIIAAVDDMPLHNRQYAKILALAGDGQRELLDSLKEWMKPRPSVLVFSPPDDYCMKDDTWH